VTPDYARFSPHPINLSVTLHSLKQAVLPRSTAKLRSDKDCRGRGCIRVPAVSKTAVPIPVEDADAFSKYCAIVVANPLMSVWRPEGQPSWYPCGPCVRILNFYHVATCCASHGGRGGPGERRANGRKPLTCCTSYCSFGFILGCTGNCIICG